MKLTTLRCVLRKALPGVTFAGAPESIAAAASQDMGWRAQLDDGVFLVLVEAKTEDAAIAGALRVMADHYDRKASGAYVPPPAKG